jgi:hypothetical protein
MSALFSFNHEGWLGLSAGGPYYWLINERGVAK